MKQLGYSPSSADEVQPPLRLAHKKATDDMQFIGVQTLQNADAPQALCSGRFASRKARNKDISCVWYFVIALTVKPSRFSEDSR
jgi:hypothetical protein